MSSLADRIKRWVNKKSKAQISGSSEIIRKEEEHTLDPVAFDDEFVEQEESIIQRSAIRDKLAAFDNIDDAKYSGKVSSRKNLGFEMQDSENEDDEDDEDYDSDEDEEIETDIVQAMMVIDPELEKQLDEVKDDGVVLIKRATDDEKKNSDSKGQHVKNQRILWEIMMDIRIKMQKPLIMANRIPSADLFENLVSDAPELKEALDSTRSELLNLQIELDKLRKLVQNPPQVNDTSSSLDQNSDISKSWKSLEPQLKESRKRHFEVIDKWSLKTQLAQGKLSKSKTSGLKSLNQSVSKQILSAMEDKERLMQRARTARVHYSVIGNEKEDSEPDFEKAKYRDIYDDTDFYHRLLKEMMNAGSGSVVGAEYDQISESINEASAVAKQKRVNSKDMKASKGRKIRYTVETKLVNFMAPEPIKGDLESISSDLFLTLYKNFMNQQKCSA